MKSYVNDDDNFFIFYNDDNFFILIREGVQMKKTFLNGHCPYRSYPPLPAGQRATWSFFWPPKTAFKRVLRNQISIENDCENDEYDDENGDNFDV